MYNNLNQTYWTTRNGDHLNPLTDMKADHIVNVMNMLQDRGRKNEERQMLLLNILSVEEVGKFRNGSRQMDIFTLDELKESPLYKVLTMGLKNAISVGNIDSNPNYETPRVSSFQDYSSMNGYEPDWYQLK